MVRQDNVCVICKCCVSTVCVLSLTSLIRPDLQISRAVGNHAAEIEQTKTLLSCVRACTVRTVDLRQL